MDNRSEIREFLTSRRARITPQEAGLPVFGGTNRRVAGLRREEVAMLAGVSIDYYTRLERGALGGVSEGVLDALADALRVDDAERAHLFDLARNAGRSIGRTRRRATQHQVRPTVLRVVESMTAPAFVRNSRTDILAANDLGRALYAPLFEDPRRPVNTARFTFLNPKARDFFGEWERSARDIVSTLRAEAGRNPYDRALTDLVGELCTRSDEFRTWWAAHDVRRHRAGTKHVRHPIVGDLHLAYELMELPADEGLSVVTYSAERGSASQDALDLLASWSATATAPNPAR